MPPVSPEIDKNLPATADGVFQFLTPELANKFAKRMTAQPRYFGLPEPVLKKLMRERKVPPGPSDNRLKMRFWDLYDQCTSGELTRINPNLLCRGICSESYFMNEYINRPERVAWILTPPTEYLLLAREALSFGVEQFRDILELPHFDATTQKVNVALINVKIKIVQMLDLRAHGAPTQKQVNLNIGASSKEVNALAEHMTMEALQKKIAELDKLDRKAQHVDGNTIDVEIIGN